MYEMLYESKAYCFVVEWVMCLVIRYCIHVLVNTNL